MRANLSFRLASFLANLSFRLPPFLASLAFRLSPLIPDYRFASFLPRLALRLSPLISDHSVTTLLLAPGLPIRLLALIPGDRFATFLPGLALLLLALIACGLIPTVVISTAISTIVAVRNAGFSILASRDGRLVALRAVAELNRLIAVRRAAPWFALVRRRRRMPVASHSITVVNPPVATSLPPVAVVITIDRYVRATNVGRVVDMDAWTSVPPAVPIVVSVVRMTVITVVIDMQAV